MAAIWKGSVSFGLVNIPVELRTAVRADHISFRLLDQGSTKKPAAKTKRAATARRSRSAKRKTA